MTKQIPIGKPFQLGNKGKPLGSKNKRTEMKEFVNTMRARNAIEPISSEDAQTVQNMIVALAQKGDPFFCRLMMDIVREDRENEDRYLPIELPKADTLEDMKACRNVVMDSFSLGQLSADMTEKTLRILKQGYKLNYPMCR